MLMLFIHLPNCVSPPCSGGMASFWPRNFNITLGLESYDCDCDCDIIRWLSFIQTQIYSVPYEYLFIGSFWCRQFKCSDECFYSIKLIPSHWLGRFWPWSKIFIHNMCLKEWSGVLHFLGRLVGIRSYPALWVCTQTMVIELYIS